jgi:hypothetical protein
MTGLLILNQFVCIAIFIAIVAVLPSAINADGQPAVAGAPRGAARSGLLDRLPTIATIAGTNRLA